MYAGVDLKVSWVAVGLMVGGEGEHRVLTDNTGMEDFLRVWTSNWLSKRLILRSGVCAIQAAEKDDRGGLGGQSGD